jgi:hypothetical protein
MKIRRQRKVTTVETVTVELPESIDWQAESVLGITIPSTASALAAERNADTVTPQHSAFSVQAWVTESGTDDPSALRGWLV